MDDQLVDRIYEAAAVPQLWLPVLDSMSAMAGGAGASFVTGGPGVMRWVATPAMESLIGEYGANPHPNPRITDVMIRRHPGFMTDHMMFEEEAIDRDPFYTDFMRPRGYGWCIGTAVFPPSADPIIFAVERRYSDGPADPRLVPRLDAFRPHLARAATLSAQLALERARATVDALGRVGLPAAVLDHRNRLRAANSGFHALVPFVAADRRERLTFTDKAADRLFADTLGRLKAVAPGGTRSIPLRAVDGRRPMVVHILPVRRAAHDVFDGSHAIVVVTPLGESSTPSAQLLEGLFDLTPAEARVARSIGLGSTVEDIVATQGVSANTVRTHLKAVFAKTGTARQAELARLLGSALPDATERLMPHLDG